MKTSLTRNAFLKSSTATIALPFLESFGFKKFASAASQAAPAIPKRMIWMGMGFGVTADKWFPKTEDERTDYSFPSILKPLEAHRNDLSFIQNLTNL